jgi:hypothetical protein
VIDMRWGYLFGGLALATILAPVGVPLVGALATYLGVNSVGTYALATGTAASLYAATRE